MATTWCSAASATPGAEKASVVLAVRWPSVPGYAPTDEQRQWPAPWASPSSRSLSSRTDRRPPRRALQVGPVRGGEAELLVEPVRVAGVQAPAEARPGPAVDHGFNQLRAKPLAPGLGHHEDVREVGVADAVGERPGKAGHPAGTGVISAHH